MTQRTKLAAAAVLVAGLAALLLLWHHHHPGDTEAAATPPDHPTGPAAGPHRVKAPTAAPPPIAPVAMDDDPVGPLRLEGQVIDEDESPVGGALVTLSSNPPRTATTEEDGSFAFDKLVGRTYSLSARKGDQVGGPLLYALTGKSDPAILHMQSGAIIDATVVAAAGGAPVAGAQVSLSAPHGPTATTDKDGQASLHGVAPGSFAVLSARASGYAPGHQMVAVPEAPGAHVRVRVELPRGAPVSGVVVDPQGHPVAGAQVVARDTSQALSLAGDGDAATSDKRGRFQLTAVAAGTYHFEAHHPHHAPGSSDPRTVDGSTPTTGVRIVLGAGGTVAGKVVDQSGAPVAWATVRVGIGATGFGGGDAFTRQVTADEQGHFEMKGLPRRALLALAMSDAASSPSVKVDLESTEARRDLVLRLELGGRIEGTVVDDAGTPVPEVSVTARPDVFAGQVAEDYSLRGAAVRGTDGGGHFAFRGLPPGTYRLYAGRGESEAAPFRRRGVQAATGDLHVKVVLEKPGSLRGRVALDDGSVPAAFTVSVGFPPGVPVVQSSAFTVPSVPPGTYDVTFRGPEFAQKVVRDVAVAAGQAVDMGTVTVQRGRSVSGRVLRADGSPVAGAHVVLGRQLLGDGKSLSSSLATTFGDSMGLRQTESDESGRYTLSGIGTSKDLLLAAEHDSDGRSPPVLVPAGSESRTIDLVLAGVGSVSGTVTAGGKPAASAQVAATPLGASKQTILVTTADDGTYEIDRLAAGDYKVTAIVGGGMGGGSMASDGVTIAAGKKAHLDLDVAVGDVTLVVKVEPRGAGTIDLAQVFLFSGAVDLKNGKQVQDKLLASSGGGTAKMVFAMGASPARFTEVAAGAYSVCVLPITGDMNDQQFVQRLQEQAEKLAVYCTRKTVTAAPAEQTYTAAVPPMAPLPPPQN